MTKQFSINCEHCSGAVEFDIEECPRLEEHISACEAKAEGEGRSEVEDEFVGFVHPTELDTSGGRLLFEISAAIRRGDRGEAELLLDKLADGLGVSAIEQVQQGRFSLLARRAA